MKKIFKYLCLGLMMLWLGGGLFPAKAVADVITMTTMYYIDIYVYCDVRRGDPSGTIRVDYGDGYTRDYEAKYLEEARIKWYYSDYPFETAKTVIITTDCPLVGLRCEACRSTKIVNNLTSFDLSRCPSLKYLHCSGCEANGVKLNELLALDLSNHTSLEGLHCSNNGLSSLDLSNLTSLKELDCSNNGLSSLDLSNLTSLKELDCSNNALTTLQFEGELRGLNAANNHLTLSMLDLLSKKWDGTAYNAKPLLLSPQRIVQALSVGENWDLTSEMTIDGAATAYTLTDEAGAPVSEAACVEKDGVFRFRQSGKYLLTLTNPQVTDNSYYDEDYQGYVADEQVEVVYEVTVSGTDIAVYTVEATLDPAVGGTVSQSGRGR